VSVSPPCAVRRALHSFPTRRSSDLDLLRLDPPGIDAGRVAGDAGGVDRRLGDIRLVQSLFRAFKAERFQVEADDLTGGVEDLARSEEHTSELQSRENLVCRLLLETK